LNKCFSDFRCVDLFQRYSRSKSKVVENRAEFWTFFAVPIFYNYSPIYLPSQNYTAVHYTPSHLITRNITIRYDMTFNVD